jgi:trans-aconitate methyltransferase
MEAFDRVSDNYRERALVQQKAAAKLIELLAIGESDDVLDVACGPGHITSVLSHLSRGRVEGVDVAEGMIRQAKSHYPETTFRRLAAEELDYTGEFSVVLCNSSLQWFHEPGRAVQGMYDALKPQGRLGVACPATAQWCELFIDVVKEVSVLPRLNPVFRHWRSPWFWLPTLEQYRDLFERSGFTTRHGEITHEHTEYSLAEAFGVYLSGAGNGFTSRTCYDIPITDEYVAEFNQRVYEALQTRAREGKVTVDFWRLYYIGLKA